MEDHDIDQIREEWLYQKRKTPLDNASLREVARDYYFDKFSLYNSSLEEFIQRGFGILGRTMIECIVDCHC